MIKRAAISILFCFLLVIVSISYLNADETANNNQTNKNSDNAMVKFIDNIEIYGRIHKPQAIFFIPGTDPRVDGIRIERHFFTNIFRTVEKDVLTRHKQETQRTNDHILW